MPQPCRTCFRIVPAAIPATLPNWRWPAILLYPGNATVDTGRPHSWQTAQIPANRNGWAPYKRCRNKGQGNDEALYSTLILFIFNPHQRICSLILERKEGRGTERERERERDKHWLLASHTCPDQESNCNLLVVYGYSCSFSYVWDFALPLFL